MVFQFVFSGATYTVAIATGIDGWTLIAQSAAGADDVEINAAIAYVGGLGGGSVFLARGNYDVTATLNVSIDIMLVGVGWDTILQFNSGGNCVTITGDNVKIRDLKIEIVAGAGGVGTRPNGIYASGRTNLEVFGVWLVGDGTVADDGSDLRQCGIVLYTVTYSRVALCKINDHKRHGIYLGNSSDNTVTGNTCNGNTQRGIHLYSSSDNTVTGNTCSGNAQIGILLVSSSDNNTVTGNTCSGNTQHGIYLGNSSDNTVTGNTCNGNAQIGILLEYSSDNNTVTGNTCNGNDSGNTGTYDGINLTGSSGNLVANNTCKDNDRWGIMVDDGSDSNKIQGNYTSGNTSGSIRINNANCDTNQIEFNTVEEGAPGDAGTNTRSYGNYDPSANAFVGDVGASPW
jgi:parallel beta-helix repeat protein